MITCEFLRCGEQLPGIYYWTTSVDLWSVEYSKINSRVRMYIRRGSYLRCDICYLDLPTPFSFCISPFRPFSTFLLYDCIQRQAHSLFNIHVRWCGFHGQGDPLSSRIGYQKSDSWLDSSGRYTTAPVRFSMRCSLCVRWALLCCDDGFLDQITRTPDWITWPITGPEDTRVGVGILRCSFCAT